jgi:hypothetical protein
MARAPKLVRVERPSEIPLGEFLGDLRKWLDHHCVMLASLNPVTLANKSGVFDALFDDPRDARLFGRRFAVQRREAGAPPQHGVSHI